MIEEISRKLLLDLVSVYTPPGYEHRLEYKIREWSEKLGYDKFYVDDVGNIFLKRGGGRKSILLAGHLDTVPGELEVKIIDDEVYGRGAVDAKGSLTSFILGGALAEKLNVEVVVGCMVHEESDGLGARNLLHSKIRPDYIIVGEPTNLAIAVAYRGSIYLQVRSQAVGGHSSTPYITDSALRKLIKFIELVESRFNGSRFEEITAVTTMLKSGDWFSKIPEYGEASMNIRFPPNINAEEIVKTVREIAEHVGVDVDFESIEMPVQISLNTEIVHLLMKSLIKNGLKPRIVRKTGTSDMNTLISISKNICAFGPGDSRLAHTRYEKIRISDVITGAKVISSLIELLSEKS
ncbi:MAG: N-acetyl-lysine deacetylase [Nitrososphaerota archaeon]